MSAGAMPVWSNPPGVHTPVPHYSHVALVGDLLFLSGQLALDLDNQLIGRGDAVAQARQCWANIASILGHYGAGLESIVKTTTYITDRRYRPLVAQARDERFPVPPYPPNTLVVVAGLAEPPFLVEIEAIAVVARAHER